MAMALNEDKSRLWVHLVFLRLLLYFNFRHGVFNDCRSRGSIAIVTRCIAGESVLLTMRTPPIFRFLICAFWLLFRPNFRLLALSPLEG
jgi:hypothetical protein